MTCSLFRLLVLAVLTTATLTAVDVTTQHNDTSRTGANLAETVLTPANVNQNTFGKVFECALDDEMYAQPLYLSGLAGIAGGTHNVVYAATVNNSVYAFDADTGATLWSRLAIDTDGTHIVPLFSNMTGACGGNYKDFDSHMGIVGSPVIDRPNFRMYFLARVRTNDANPDTATYSQRLHVVDVRTGAELANSPSAPITATVPGTGDGTDGTNISFDPRRNNQRVSILLHPGNGNIYLGWSSHCDWGPYHGWFMGYSYSAGAGFTQVCKMSTTPNSNNGGIWMSNNGCATDPADGTGSIFFSSGNGVYHDGVDFADSLLRVNPTTAAVIDWFTPYNEVALNAADADFGVSGPMLIPGLYGGKSLLLTTSKEGKFYVVDRAAMNHKTTSTTADDLIIQAFQPFAGHIHGSAVFFDANTAKYAYAWSENDYLKSFTLQASGQFVTAPAAQSAMQAPGGMPGGFLSISAAGQSNGIVWASLPWSGNANQQTQPGVLRAFDAVTLTELWNSHQFLIRDDLGNFAKDSNPTIANGKVYLATFSNKLCAFGLIPQNNTLAVLITSPANNAVLAEPATNLAIAASASTGSGTISKVEFFVDGVLISNDTTAPYGATRTLYAGSHTLQAMVTDSNGAKALSPTVTVTVTGNGVGSILREFWSGLSATVTIASFATDTANYTTTPNARSQPTTFEAPTNIADTYGTRMRGYVHPPVTGTYTFWIASDDNGELWLSTDTNPANITATNGGLPICKVPNWTNPEDWNVDPAQKSAGITLTGGQKYYIEALMKENNGGDNLAVGWQLPDGSYERPIGGAHLSPFVLAATPTVTNVNANSGTTAGGTGVTVTGTGFTGASGVTFGGVAATGLVVSNATTITCTTPAHYAGAVNVDVTVSGLVGTEVGGFTYLTPAGTPTITAVSPSFGATTGGTSITITGTNLTGTSAVSFGGTAAATFTVNNATTITATTAAHAPGPVDVVVTNATATATASNAFCYVLPAGSVSITAIVPSTGSTNGGTAVTITGLNFTSVTGVTFGGGAATSVVASGGTTITCMTPAHAAGAVNVTVTTSTSNATSAGGYTFVVPPTITSISPTSGGAGTSITITGTNLAGATSVTIGGAALTITVDNPTQISATIPAGTVSGPVVVTTGGGAVTSATTFNAPSSTSSKCGGGLFALIGLLLLTQIRRFRQTRQAE